MAILKGPGEPKSYDGAYPAIPSTHSPQDFAPAHVICALSHEDTMDEVLTNNAQAPTSALASCTHAGTPR